ncbi:hypothetical protein [Bowmanella dokdonensis]|uniref:Uncharacterized protein n=1 Tax=Bowmanella dokdonensis TaxID=751969 RepID=A0A939DMK5_9ALTE|nr:hypothetical protein [Bowmanella dokdonensis]MBN7825354.1 hypothetical protein [Bowmanella dokdonensis]
MKLIFLILSFTSAFAFGGTAIDGNPSNGLQVIDQWIHENSYYDSFTDAVYVTDTSTGAVSKYNVEHFYNGETYTIISPSTTTTQERQAFKDFSDGIKAMYADFSGDGFYQVPSNLVSNGLELARHSFYQNDFKQYAESRLNETMLGLIDRTLVNTASILNINIKDVKVFTLADQSKITVEFKYTRTKTLVNILKIIDKYNNTIGMTHQEIQYSSYRVDTSDSDYLNALLSYLQSMGMSINAPTGNGLTPVVTVIECNSSGCESAN